MGLVITKMPSIPELAAQLDTDLSKPLIESDHLFALLEQIINLVGTPEGCQDLNDLVFNFIPTLVNAAGQSKACEKAAERLLQAAAEKCVPREVFSALAAALSEAMQNPTSSEHDSLGASSLHFHSILLQLLTTSLLRLKKLSTAFLREHVSLATNWCRFAQQQEDEDACLIGELGFCTAVAPIFDAVALQADFAPEERKSAQQILCRSILQVAGAALITPTRLEKAAVVAHATLLEAQSTLTGKIFRFQPLLLDLLSRGPEQILPLLVNRMSPQFGIRSLEDLLEITVLCEAKTGEDEGEAVGAAAAVCSSMLHFSASTTRTAPTLISATPCLKSPDATGKVLKYILFTLNTLTDAAAQHQSVPLAILPLLTIAQYFRQLGANESPLEESYVSLTMPIISTLVAVMSLNPVEIVRTCAYEALHTFLDAMVPQARFLALQNMTSTTSSSTVIAAVALQRLRLEISPAVLQPPFTHSTALQIALPWFKEDVYPPSWSSEEDVLQNADVIAAALSVLRFVLLQQVALRRKVIVDGEEGEQREGVEVTVDIPVQLQPEKLQNLIKEHLKPLHVCTTNLIHRIESSLDGQETSSSQINADLEVFLALQRLEEVLDRTLEAAKGLL
jgi:hypothetical protein